MAHPGSLSSKHHRPILCRLGPSVPSNAIRLVAYELARDGLRM